MKDVEADPVLIGGMVLDIQATPSIAAKPKTTTPGKVRSFTLFFFLFKFFIHIWVSFIFALVS